MKRMQKRIQTAVWILIFLLGLYILYRGLVIAKENHFLQKIPVLSNLQREIESIAVKTHMPGLTYTGEETSRKKEWMDYVLEEVFPLYSYAEEQTGEMPAIESRPEADLLADVSESEQSEAMTETETPQTETKPPETETESTQTEAQTEMARAPVVEIDTEKLKDYDYLLNNFYAVDPSTTAQSSQINYDLLMSKDMKMTSDNSAPQILIYHTHSQEAFVDSVEGDVSTTIVGVGERLTEILRDTYGFNVIHHTVVYDMIDGELDRNKAYNLAAPDVEQILAENPSIEVVIDLHRDGVDGHKFVKEINGKPTAQIMFFNGLSRTARNGDIDYLPNPHIEDNLAFSFQLQLKAAQYYPEWTRNIYLQSLRYNLHMRPKALLIESGTQLNTVQEELNAMEPLADILNQVLHSE